MISVYQGGCQRGWRLSIILCITLLSACGHLRERSTAAPDNWDQRAAQQSAIAAWYVQGRLGIKTEQQAGSLDVFWNQQGARYQIRLLAPLGQGAYFIKGDADAISLKNANGEISSARNADQLFAESLGLNLPLDALRYWLRGLPAPGAGQLEWDELGNLYILHQQGWRVEMARYQQQGELNLPQAFYLSRADQPELMIRLLLDRWQLTDLPALEP